MSDEAKFTVRLVDKVKTPAKGATSSVKGLFQAFKSAPGVAGVMNGALAQTSRGLSALGGSASGAFAVFSGNVLTAAAGKLFELAGAAVMAGAKFVTFGQESRMAFDSLAKNGASGEDLFEHAGALARRFGLDLFETTNQYKKFLALQFDPAGADRMIRMGADLRALGATAADVQGVFTALGQIKGKGKLQAEELQGQLAERGISREVVFEEIGKLTGKDMSGVEKLMQQGKVDATTGLQAIENAIKRQLNESNLGEMGAKAADTTLRGLMGKFDAWADSTGVKLFDKVAAPLTTALGGAFSTFTEFLSSPQGAATIDKIAGGLGKAAEFAVDLAGVFGPAFMATWDQLSAGAAPFFEMLGGADGVSTVQMLGTALGQVAALGVAFAISLGVVTAGAVALGGAIWNLGTAIVGGFAETWGLAIGKVIDWWDTLTAIWNDGSKGLIEKARDLGVQVMKGLANGILGLIDLPIQAISNVGSTVVDTLKGILGIHSPSRVTLDMGLMLGEGLAIGTDRSIGTVETSSADMARSSVGAMSFDAPAGRGGGDIHLTVQVEVHTGSGDPNEIGESVASAARREVEAMFRQLALQV